MFLSDAKPIPDAHIMKIAIVAHPQNVFPPAGGSVARVIWESARRLPPQCQVTIFSRRASGLGKSSCHEGLLLRRVAVTFDEQIVLRLVSYLRRFLGLEQFAWARGYFYFWFIVKVALCIRRRGFDLVHLHNYTHFATIMRWLNPTVPIVLHMHCHWLMELDRGMAARRLAAVDAIVSPCASLHDQTRARFSEHAAKCLVVHNGVDHRFFHKKRAASFSGNGCGRQHQQILFVGRITPEKGVHVLLEAMAIVQRAFPEAALLLAGGDFLTPASMHARADGVYQKLEGLKRDYRGYLHQQITRLGLAAQFVGYKSSAELTEYYSQARVVVCLLGKKFRHPF